MMQLNVDEAALDRLLGRWADTVRLTPAETLTIRQSVVQSQPIELDAAWWRTVFSHGIDPLRRAIDIRTYRIAGIA
jgi:hypothetical protein